jgi:hypothetical protein
MKIFYSISILLVSVCIAYAQNDSVELNVLSSSTANDNVVYTLGDIYIDDTSGTLGGYAFQLFYEGSVSVDATLDSKVEIFPNPASNHLTITSEEVIKTIKILDVYGREVLLSYRGDDVDLSGIDVGIYIIVINNRSAFKITKQ